MSDAETGIEEGLEGAPAADEPLSSDTVYSVLSDKRRRYAIHHLKQCRGPIPVSDLAEQVAAWENEKSVDELVSQERKRVYIALYQSHLPTLDEEGIVEYDTDRGTVEISDAMAELDIYLEVVPEGNVPWSLYYVGLTAVGAALLGLAWLDVYPFDLLSDLAWGAVILAFFGVSAFVQTYYSRRMRFGDSGPPPELKSTQ